MPVCDKCRSRFQGFGTTCGACRKAGQAGTFISCSECGDCFNGFGSSCPDCQNNQGICQRCSLKQLPAISEVQAISEDELASISDISAAGDSRAAEETHFAFVFIKPHAITEEMKSLVKQKMGEAGISLTAEGEIAAEAIDKKGLIDTHYGAIAAKAMKHKPERLIVQQRARELFESKFGLSWDSALRQKLVFNAKDACEKLGVDYTGMDARWSELKKGETLLKFGGGFYVGKVDEIFVVNGFYMDMRSNFTKPGAAIYFYLAEWSSADISWADFRRTVLGATDPSAAVSGSIRNTVYNEWQSLGLASEPNTGLNGMHASASPFEGLCERCNWLDIPLRSDPFGKALLAKRVHAEIITAFMADPPVDFGGKVASVFDRLEDLCGKECLHTVAEMASHSVRLAEETHFAFVFIKPHAVTEEMKALVRRKMGEAGIGITAEGQITAEAMGKKKLIDKHYTAIAAKAMKLKPDSLIVQPQARALFKSKFGLDWDDALRRKLVYNAKDACEKLGTGNAGINAKWSQLRNGETLLRFGAGFYIGKIESIYVVNGFYMNMRDTFTTPGAAINYYLVEWGSAELSWADFRRTVLGATDPAAALPGSIRNTAYQDWKVLRLPHKPNIAWNGVHASTSPFEGLCERLNWLGMPLETDHFGQALLAKGVPPEVITKFMEDPLVNFEGKVANVFDRFSFAVCATRHRSVQSAVELGRSAADVGRLKALPNLAASRVLQVPPHLSASRGSH